VQTSTDRAGLTTQAGLTGSREGASARNGEVKVRATFSWIMGQLKIDTSMSWKGPGCAPGRGTTPGTRDARGTAETFRTRRVINLSHVTATAAGTTAAADGESSGVNPRSTISGARDRGSSSGGSESLKHLDMRGWSEEEREAVRRLLILEAEWGRFV
jgi:hypothetical protein